MKRLHLFAVVALLLCQSLPAHAAGSLEDLLKQTKETRAAQDKLTADRIAAFNSSSQPDQLLKNATAERDTADAANKAISDQYDANEIKINQLQTQLQQKEATLGLNEIFSLARQVSGDVAAILGQSMITVRFPPKPGETDREAFLRAFAAEKDAPTSPELERLWFEIQREMTASGRVVRFGTNVVQADGTTQNMNVVQVGPFTTVANDNFLTYLPDLKVLNILSRQPPEKFLDGAERLEKATSGYVSATVDPSRGVLVSLYSERPTVVERVERGHEVGYVIITVGLIGALLWVIQFLYLIAVRLAVGWQLRNLNQPKRNNPLGRVLLAFKGDPKQIEENAEVAELRITEAVLHEVPKLERFQAFLRLAVAAGPLLGLIGTVIGMIITFQSITESGSSDPKLMANGIGTAMIATVLGLGIAIPLLFANAGLAALSRTIVQILDEQSAGMLAESIEKRTRA